MTLGIPQLPEDWGNDRVLSFVRYMWAHWTATKSVELGNAMPTKGPAPPSMVAAAAKKAFGSLSHSDEAKILFQNEHHSQADDDNPIVAPDTTILVRSNSGRNLQMPCWDNQVEIATPEPDLAYNQESWESDTDSFDRSSYTCSSESLHNVLAPPPVDHERRNKNLGWLRSHLQSLNEVANLASNNADLWQLHQYFFSPAYTAEDDLDNYPSEDHDDGSEKDGSCGSNASPKTPAPSEVGESEVGRAISFKTLGKAVAKAANEVIRPKKRGSLEEELKYHQQPCAKRPKQLKPRIAYYPRVRERLESLGTKPSAQTLCLLRQLKYVESVMLRGKNVYAQREKDEDESPNTTDVEMVLLDLL
jgi:hypothetical protein